MFFCILFVPENISWAGNTNVGQQKNQPRTYALEIRALPRDVNPGASIRPHVDILELNCGKDTQRLVNLSFPVRKTFIWSPDKCEDVTVSIEVGTVTIRKVYSGPSGFPDFVKAFSNGYHIFRAEDFTKYNADALEHYGIDFFLIRYRLIGDIEPVMKFSSE